MYLQDTSREMLKTDENNGKHNEGGEQTVMDQY